MSTEVEIDEGRCIRCGACALLAPGVFEMGSTASRVRRDPAAGGERVFAQAAVLICPTLAIRLRARPASDGAGAAADDATAAEPLYPRLAHESEKVRWRLEAVPWGKLAPDAASPTVRALVREMAFSEHATYSATQRFMQSFGDDVDFTQWLSVWFYEETRHPHALMEWLRRLGERHDDAFVLRGRVSTPFMRSKTGTLVTNVVSEVTAATAYQSLGRWDGEPALAEIATFIAGDEARHAASFFLFARRRQEGAPDPARERLDALKVLHFWLNETTQVSHPINQMLERVRADGTRGGALGAVAFDFDGVKRRVTRLIGLLAGVPLGTPDEVLPALKTLTADVHRLRREDGAAEG
jgi:ferredoxin